MLNGSFRKFEEQWTAGIESGQGEAPKVGDEITITKKDKTVKHATLIAKLGEKSIGETGGHITFWTFSEGWVDDNEPF